MRFLTPVEIARLAEVIRPPYRVLVLVGAYGGLRIGELAGLRRERVDLAPIREAATNVEPYVRADGTRIWSLMQLERQLWPEAYGRCRGGYVDRRHTPTA